MMAEKETPLDPLPFLTDTAGNLDDYYHSNFVKPLAGAFEET